MKTQKMNKLALLPILLVILISIIFASFVPQMVVGAAPPHASTATAVPPSAVQTAPMVVATVPERGEEQPLNRPIEITFDQPMNRASVEKAFAIEPGASVDGKFEWLNDQTMHFSLKKGFQRGARYTIRLVETAESQSGLKMSRPFEFRFSVVGFLEVSNVQPTDGATEILPDSIVTVAFNHPVVPLKAIEESGNLPDPLTFMPPVTGHGKWLNTSVYQFTADKGFAPATEYTARIAKGLADVLGQAELVDDFSWKFTTLSPMVVGSMPSEGDIYVSPSPVISVAFNQVMNRASVEKNFSLVNQSNGQAIKGKFAWAKVGLLLPQKDEYNNPLEGKEVGVETVTFIPTELLKLETGYQLKLLVGTFGSITNTKTRHDYTASFTTIAAPKIVSTDPKDGTDFVQNIGSATVVFNAPMNPETAQIGKNIILEPLLTSTEVYSYWNNNDTELSLNFSAELNTAYTMTIKGDITGRYGQPLEKTTIVHWNTLNNVPSIRFLSPRVATYNAYEPTRLYLTVRNLKQTHFSLYQIPGDDFIKLNGNNWYEAWDKYKPASSYLVREWNLDSRPSEAHINYIYPLTLTSKAGESLKPGIYYLEGSAKKEAIYPQAKTAEIDLSQARVLVVVSKNALTLKQSNDELLAWVTDLQSGQPISNVRVSFVKQLSNPENQNIAPNELGKINSDKDGVALLKYKNSDVNNVASYFAFVDDADQFAASTTEWNEGIGRYDFRNINVEDWRQPYNGVIYTDRNIYRPGQLVNFKAILRADDDANYTLPPTGDMASVVIMDAQSREVFSQTFPLNGMGSLNGQFRLDENAALGSYSIMVNYQDTTFYNDFNVAEYRKPEFLVKVTADKAEYTQGETIKMVAETEFFFGGPVVNALVRWNVLSDNYYFNFQPSPDSGEGYSFIDEDYNRFSSSNYYPGFGQLIASGEGKTDKDGRFMVEVPADIVTKHSSQQFTLEVVVTGLNNQEVANQTTAVVHKGDFYIGLRPKAYIGMAGAENKVEVIVVDPQSKPVANQEVELVFAEQQWYSVQLGGSDQTETDKYYWENTVESVAVFSTTVTTGKDGQAMASFTPKKGGAYKVYARAIDKHGRAIFSSTYLWVSGGQFINWGQANNDCLELVTDKRAYKVGDVAKVMIPHPYSGTVKTLVTLERGNIYSYTVITLQSNSDQIEIPITEDLMPNIFVAVVVVKGIDESNKLPSFKVGYVNLPIASTEKNLHITLTPNKSGGQLYKPGDKAEYRIKVTDFQSKPIKTELSLALIDKAILTLSPDKPNQLLDTFWRKRGLGVRTGSGLTLAIARLNQVIDQKKGGGGGSGDRSLIDKVREKFTDAPLWVADFVTDDKGEGIITADLPDNLTTWVLLGKGVTGADTRVGEGQVEIVSTKPLLVRAVAPRFFVVGDEVRLGMIVQNNSGKALTVEPNFEAEGLEIKPVGVQKSLSLKVGEEAKVEYDVTVGNVETARLTMGVKSTDLSDAVAFELPIYRFSSPETVATVGVLTEDGLRTESIVMPRKFDPTQGNLTVSIDPSLAAGMRDGLTYLESYPYECTEQTVSRFLPNVFTYRAYQTLKLKNPELEKKLPILINTSLQRLYNDQHYDGGWGWWVTGESNPILTAYVLLGLVEAQRLDMGTVDEQVISQAVSYLQNNLLEPQDVAHPWQANQQAFVLYVLAEAGQGDQGRVTALFGKREQLDMFGRAYLAMAMHLLDKSNKQINTLINDITSKAISSATGAHWEEEQVDFYAMNTDTRSTAIIVTALSRIQPDHALLPQSVRWLMSIREHGGHWETTQETAWAIIGLTDWLAVSADLTANYSWNVSLNGDSLSKGNVDETNLADTTKLKVGVAKLLADAGSINRLAIERDPSKGAPAGSKGQGNLYYAAYLTYYKPVQEVKAIDRGIMVSRQYSLYSPQTEGGTTPTPTLPLQGRGSESKAMSEAKVGQVIEVKLTLIVPNDLHYVVVEDPLPAGTEGVDSSLATTSIVNQQPELNRTDRADMGGNSRWYFAYTQLRDEKAVLFATFLPKGTYEYSYLIRAAIPGQYRVIPTHAEEMYFPEVFGNSDGGVFEVKE